MQHNVGLLHEPISVKAPLIAAWTGRRDVGGIHGDNGAPFEGPVSDLSCTVLGWLVFQGGVFRWNGGGGVIVVGH